MFELSAGYAKRGMAAYSELQQLEFASESKGYTCSKHQREVPDSTLACVHLLLHHKLVDVGQAVSTLHVELDAGSFCLHARIGIVLSHS